MAFVTVKNKRGDTQRVPEHWIGHPVLGAGFEPIEPASSDSEAVNVSEPEPSEAAVDTPAATSDNPRRRKTTPKTNGGHEDA